MIRGVILDYDGVIVDSFENQFNAWKYTCEINNKKFPYASLDELRKDYEEPFTNMYEKFGFNWERDKGFLVKQYKEFTDQNQDNIPLFKGIDKVINTLHNQEFKLGIVTQNLSQIVIPKLNKFSLYECFNHIITAENKVKIKPDPDGLLTCILALEIEPNQAVYVGDLPSDVVTAIAAGTGSISHLNGYSTLEKFKELSEEEFNYTTFVENVEEILSIVMGSK